ncbi:hypothetical protein HU200_001223 [Digitaria exilis]|uniref:Uncharacterized protein n=1 Tax=Digitaria exilis TaxID=1010633 RepID=A0A835FYT6_9POAL|nr:hypothetical protein HU200_024933 [Digitaria exilis]KAF8780622.1 hypothetical protein HU200_001223 [Digitaria exilis]CAB3484105.1 unnamed protein product [Digitaria exilis]CAB3486646.1 unnamed protein product [Digitaria exilis]
MAEGNDSGSLFSSGKLVAEAATTVFQQKSVDNIDKKEVAGAASEILHAASSYGKLEDKPAGQYIEKAESYLKEFSSGAPAAAADAKPAGDEAPAAAAAEAPKPAEPAAEAPKEAAPAAEEGKPEGFGLDDVVKGAEQLVEKQGGGGDSASGGGAGGLFKMAQGFLK